MRRAVGNSLLASVAALYAGLFTILSFRRHDSFGTWALDMGNMDQAVWNTVHGRILAFTNMEGITTRLAIHFEPTLILVSPIYFLWSDPRALLLLQTVFLAAGSIPVFWMARRSLKSEWAGLAIAAVYLLFPSTEAVNMAEFHPVALSVPLLLWSFHFGSNRQWTAYLLLSLLAAGTKEEIGLGVAMMALYLAISQRARLPLVVAFVGVAWSLIAVLAVIPHFNPDHISPYAYYYDYLGDGMLAKVGQLLTDPLIPAERILHDPSYLISLLLPGGFLALLSPERLLLGLPSLLINVLSDNATMHRSNMYHYSAPIIPAVMLATLKGVERVAALGQRLGLRSHQALAVAVSMVLIATALYHRSDGLTPLARGFSFPPITEHDRVGYQVLAQVPPDVSLSVQSELNPHLSQRQKLYVFPEVGDAEYVLVDRLRDPGNPDPVNNPSPGHRRDMEELRDLLSLGQFSVVLDRDGYLLLHRNP